MEWSIWGRERGRLGQSRKTDTSQGCDFGLVFQVDEPSNLRRSPTPKLTSPFKWVEISMVRNDRWLAAALLSYLSSPELLIQLLLMK
jgi:hypothetical protein